MKKFKLMQIVPSLRSGGVEQGTIDVSNHLASLEVKNYICSHGGQMLSSINRKYVEHFTLPVHSKNFFMMPFVANKLNMILINKKINLLHFRSRAPAWLLPFLNKKNLKTVSTFHNVYGNSNFFKNLYNRQLGNVNKIVAISPYVKNEIIDRYKINPNDITVINRGIDTKFFNGKIEDKNKFINFLKKYDINANKKLILFPGRLTNWKGQIEFLDIVEYFKKESIIFYFAGDDKNKSYLKKLKQKINEKKLNLQCRILGHLNKDELKMAYICSNLVISAPLQPEGFGRTISESLSMGKIILAYNFGGAKDQLDPLDDIYKIKDTKDMISKIRLALQLDENNILNLGNIARKYVISNYSKENMQNSYLNFYQKV